MDVKAPRPPGTIITFYSYKGGTGRTMALANTACVLAERIPEDERLLVVDWDLEAPGLHQFLPARLRPRGPSLDIGLGPEPGLIDLFIQIRDALPEALPTSEQEAEAAAAVAMKKIRIEEFIGGTDVAKVHIIRAGRNDDGLYSKRVNTFDWEDLFRRAPSIYRKVAARLAARYRYVLVDSRTGVTDISGICTTLLPEKLVVVFTPNRQSLTGVRELVTKATAYRLGSDDLRPLLVYPLPSRIEVSMEKLSAYWRHGNLDAGVAGYQPMFEGLLQQCYALKTCDLTAYFNAVQIQQSADCAYGEVISVRQTSGERLSLASSYRVFVDRLLAIVPPWMTEDAPVLVPSIAATEVNPAAVAPTTPSAAPVVAPTIAAPPKKPTASKGKTVFLSHAMADRSRATEVGAFLQTHGYEIWQDRELRAGSNFTDEIARQLDASDVVIAFWSKASVTSEFVKIEAGEGSRRGVLIPVLLDDTYPPLEFRRYQAVDLSRPGQRDWDVLLEAVDQVANRRGVSLDPVTHRGASFEPAKRATSIWRKIATVSNIVLATSGAVVIIALAWPRIFPGAEPTTKGGVAAIPPVGPVIVPNFVGMPVSEALRTGKLQGLSLTFESRRGGEAGPLDDVLQQTPVPGTYVSPGTTVQTIAGPRGTQLEPPNSQALPSASR